MIQTVKTKDLSVNYVRFGHGEKTLVIIPGLSIQSVLLSEDAIASAYSVFSDAYTAYLFDPRLELPRGHKIKDLAEDTAKAMQALGIKEAYVFGVSMGGMTALQLALDHPELVKKLVIGSSAPCLTKELPGGADVNEKARNFMRALYADKFAASLHIEAPQTGFSFDELSRFEIMSEAADGFDVYDRLEEIKCPALVIGAFEDQIIPKAGSAAAAQKLGCELYMYGPPYGHAVYDEAPDYKNRLYEFFQRDI